MNKPKSIVVLSGGQDSVTTLYAALRLSEVVGAVHFQYGQKHAVERDFALYHAAKVGVLLEVVDVPAFAQIGDSALLLDGYGDVCQSHPRLSHLPASFVPGRNLIFLTFAAALAMKMNATQIWTGVCQEDYAGYPDCRQSTMLALQFALQVGMDFSDLEIVTPLMNLTKAQTFVLADELGVLDDIRHRTHTCYNGDHVNSHPWGFGCGSCPACATRARGWEEFRRTRP